MTGPIHQSQKFESDPPTHAERAFDESLIHDQKPPTERVYGYAGADPAAAIQLAELLMRRALSAPVEGENNVINEKSALNSTSAEETSIQTSAVSQTQMALMQVGEQQNGLDEKISRLEATIEQKEAYLNVTRTSDLRQRYIADLESQYEVYIGLLMEAGYAEQAFNASERIRTIAHRSRVYETDARTGIPEPSAAVPTV